MTIPETANRKDWPRLVAQAINGLLNGTAGFARRPSAPSDPFEGQSYYDTTDHMARTWDGTTWQDHW